MERNNIFMWAYITFIIVAAFMRLFFDYVLWTPLVIAITISSILFAFEDLYTSLAKTLSDMCAISEELATIARKEAGKVSPLYEKMSKISFENIEYDTSSLQESLRYGKDQLTQMFQNSTDLDQVSMSVRKKQVRHQRSADFFAYSGFLCLFFIMIFASLLTIPAVFQDIITVFSFSVILITHQMNINESKKIKSSLMRYQEFLRLYEEVDERLPIMEKAYNELIKDIESLPYMAEEEAINAD